MDLRQLYYFVRIVEQKSLTRAAEQLRIAQPALGFQLRKLEDELDTQLLVRHSRGVEPTEAGLVLLERARSLLEEADLTKAAVRGFTGNPIGKVSLGIAPGFGSDFVTEVIVRCIEQLPEVSLTLMQEHGNTLLEWLRADHLDLACVGSLEPSGFLSEGLFRHDVYLVQSPRGASREPVAFSEVATYPLILSSTQTGLRARLENFAREVGVSLQVTCEVQSDVLAVELAKRSVAYTFNTYTAVRREIDEGKLVARHIIDPVISIDASIIYKERRPLSRAASAVRDVILSFVREEFPRMKGIWSPPDNGTAKIFRPPPKG